MSEQAIEQTPFWLSGNFAPTFEEVTETKLKVTGSIPPELNGRYLLVAKPTGTAIATYRRPCSNNQT